MSWVTVSAIRATELATGQFTDLQSRVCVFETQM